MATKAELYAEAQALEVEGRSEMNKAELEAAIEAAAAADPEVAEAVKELEEELVELDVSNEPDPVAEEKAEVAPVISQETQLQGGLGFITDRTQ